jgi:Ca2+-binding EF-hand superfamily protein
MLDGERGTTRPSFEETNANETIDAGSGSITVEEFAKVMSQSPGQPPSEEEVKKIIKEVDLDGDGTINFNEFITMMTGQPYPPSAGAEAAAPAAEENAEDDIISGYQ